MIDRKTNYLELPLPDEKNMLEDDCPRIRQSLQKLDAHARTTDTALAACLTQADAADEAITALRERATATEQAQAITAALVTEQGQTLLSLGTSLAAKLDDAPPTAERRGAIRVGAGLHLVEGRNGETDVLAVTPELGGNLQLNAETLITESCEWAAPVTGWYRIQMCGGGAGGYAHTAGGSMLVYSNAPGGRIDTFRWLEKDETVSVVIGTGGTPVTNAQAQQPGTTAANEATHGGDTHFVDLVAKGGSYTKAPDDLAHGEWVNPGQGWITSSTNNNYDINVPSVFCLRQYGYGGGGRIRFDNNNSFTPGGQGVVILQYHDPAKAVSQQTAPALFSARRMATPLAAANPVTVNLYDPEIGQGSVWREEDAETKLAEGLISQEAWEKICAAKAAEERAAWLADPETEAERFELLRMACEARLTATDKLTTSDYPISDEDRAAVNAYRKAIRELNHQPGAPWDGGGKLTPWPEMPTITKVTA
ncbi:phage tail assembly chaperone [Desulfovibrio sp. ZJ200]|uniref:phage tail assembly chaperone n=1 Tax=Desulfovibrio sp. ZJ200 TaxID=2709792 RepID=UPI0013EB63B5|nr:phage tail assembly chaperone [Desulfovibrio sp. ZJ200]